MSGHNRRKYGVGRRKWHNSRGSRHNTFEDRAEEMFGGRREGNERNYKKKELDGKTKSRNSYQEDGPSTSDGQRFMRHPPGLRGKAIGLWYAARSRTNKKKNIDLKTMVTIDDRRQKQIRCLLDTIHQSRLMNTTLDETSVNNDVMDIPDLNQFERDYTEHLEASSLREAGFNILDYDTKSNLNPIKELDEKLALENNSKKSHTGFNKMLEFRKKLPAYTMHQEIVKLIESNQVVVISGETGCGKSTQVPQFILDHYIEVGKGSCCSIVCTQPRRISAVSLAERVAEERNESCGGKSVGYQIRLESKLPKSQGSILYCTTGIILKRLESDEYLSGISHVIMDEVHERDLDTDFLLIVIKDLLKIRKELKLIIMSATLNSQVFSKYFDGCPMFNIPGFTYPVQQIFLEDVLALTGYSNQLGMNDRSRRKKHHRKKDEVEEMKEVFLRNLEGDYPPPVIRCIKEMDEGEIDVDLVVYLIHYICMKKEEGAILVFLPGWDLISTVHKKMKSLEYFRSGRTVIIPLHSMMPTVNQKVVFNRPPSGVRKIVLTTNIAETSITIDDVVYVIDTGKSKLSNFDVENNLATLKPEWISKANAHQRRGRAGRVQAGFCYHLILSFRYNLLDDYQLPEMLRTRLEDICLRIKILKLGKIIPFVSKALDSPSIDAVRLSVEFLQTLNALDKDENLTPLGFHLARLPVDPQAGKLILYASIFGCFDPIAIIAASLSFKDAFVIPLDQESEVDRKKLELSANSNSDHIMLVNALKGWERECSRGNGRSYCRNNYLSSNTLQLLSNMRSQFCNLLYDLHFLPSRSIKDSTANSNSDNIHLIRAVLCAGLYPNIARIMKMNKSNKRFCGPTKIVTKDGRVYLHPKSVNCKSPFESPWLVYFLKIKSARIFLHDSSMVTPYHLLLFGGNIQIQEEKDSSMLIIDEWIKFWCSKETAALIMDLRKELDLLLEYKITHPDPTIWSKESTEITLLKAIRSLLETEKIHSPFTDRESESMEKDE